MATIMDTAVCLVLSVHTALFSSVSQDLRFLCCCELHVYVGLGIGESVGSVELLAFGGECADSDELLVVFCEGVSGDELLGAGN